MNNHEQYVRVREIVEKATGENLSLVINQKTEISVGHVDWRKVNEAVELCAEIDSVSWGAIIPDVDEFVDANESDEIPKWLKDITDGVSQLDINGTVTIHIKGD